MKYPLVKIEWIDAEDNSPWQDEESTKKFFNELPIVNSVGFLYIDNKKLLGIIGDYSEEKDPDYGRLLKIPRKMVKKMVKL